MLSKHTKKDSSNAKTATISGQKVKFKSDQLIVKLKEEDVERAKFQEVCHKICDQIPTGEIMSANPSSRRVVYAVRKEVDVRKMVKEISKMDSVEYAEIDVLDEIQVVIPNDTRYVDQWSHQMVNSERAWDITQGNSSQILIGIIDSGITLDSSGNLDHPDLDSSRFIMGTDFVDGGSPRDLNAHGTHVVGIAAADSNNCSGVAGADWKSQVYICRVFDANGSGTSSNFAAAVEEIVDYAVANNLKAVINYSGGGGDNNTKRDACQYAHDNGMILCAAAGNGSGAPVISPALYSTTFDGVIAVGSTDSNDNVSGFSNVGPEITVVAPGSDILSTTPTYSVSPTVSVNYDTFNGTSMATPMVAGIIALMWSRRPSLTNVRIRQCLIDSAIPLGSGNFNNSWGFGRVDAYEAVSCIAIRRFCFPIFTPFTNFTVFTRFTPFTNFTSFTPFTRFTNFTRFTPFTNFTVFDPFTQPVPDPIVDVEPFVRFKNRILTPKEVAVENFDELRGIGQELKNAGINYVHELATGDLSELSKKLKSSEVASKAIAMGQQILEKL